MAVNWGLAAPSIDIAGLAMTGFRQGQQIRRERETDNALAAYAQGNPNAVNALMRVDPRLGIQVQRDQRQQQAEHQRQQVTAGALRGDQGSMDALAGINPDMWMKLDDRTKQSVAKATNFMAQSGLQIGQLPEHERGPAWESAVRQAESMGLDIPTQYERYTPQAFNAAMAESGKMAEFLDSMKVEWKSVGEGGLIPVSAATGLRVDQGSPTFAQQPTQQSQSQGGAQYLKRSDAERLRRSAPGKLQELMSGGAKIVPDNFDEIMSDAQDAIARGAPREAVMARAQQMLGM
jgi:hypothetical protein